MKINIKIFIILLCLFGVGITPANASTSSYEMLPIKGQYDYENTYYEFKFVNEIRKNAGLKGMKFDKKLTEQALERAKEISLYFSHTRPDGRTLKNTIANITGESIIQKCNNKKTKIDVWGAEDIYDNATNKKNKSAGVGVFKRDGITYYVYLFSSKASSSSFTKRGISNPQIYKIKTNTKYLNDVKESNIKDAQVSLKYKSYAYTGKSIKPKVTIKYGDTTLKRGKDYTITYQNNVSLGTASVTIKGKGYYNGTIKKTFKITIGNVFNVTVNSKTTSTATLKWDKSNGKITGYKIYRNTSKNGTYKLIKTIANKETLTYKNTNLKAGKTYYYKIKAYTIINGVKKYGSFSKKAKVTLNSIPQKINPENRGWLKPLNSGIVTNTWGYQIDPVTGQIYSFHNGIDIGANEGTPVYAAAPGQVIAKISQYNCGGNMLYINVWMDGKEYTTYYYHLLNFNVNVGDRVTQDTIIGYVGGSSTSVNNGGYDYCTTGAHLHFGVQDGYYNIYSGIIDSKVITPPGFNNEIGYRFTSR